MGVRNCVEMERTSNFVLLPSASTETIYKSKPNKQTRTCYAPLLRFMLYRAPKLTARTFYAPLNERSSFDGLCVTARLIGKNVRGQKLTI